MDAFLDIKNLSISFGGLQALAGVNLRISKGEIFTIIGPNGAGKTTALNVITRLYEPDEGAVAFRGEDLLKIGADRIIRKGISRTFQNVGLFPGLTAVENIKTGLHAFGSAGFFSCAFHLGKARKDEAWREARATEMLKLVNLEHLDGGATAVDLPYGQQKLVGLARALISDPLLLILDEPASGLSPIELAQLTVLIKRLRDEKGITILLVEHDMNFVMGISDRILVLNFGQKIGEGTPDEVRNDPRVIEAYLGEEEIA